MANTAAIKRGWHWDEANSNLDVYVEGTKVCSFHATNGVVPVVDAFDLSGQTLSTGVSGGSTDYTTMIGHYNSGDGSANEAAAKMLVITVGGTDYYVPCFATV